jgi:hypothetical protein
MLGAPGTSQAQWSSSETPTGGLAIAIQTILIIPSPADPNSQQLEEDITLGTVLPSAFVE